MSHCSKLPCCSRQPHCTRLPHCSGQRYYPDPPPSPPLPHHPPSSLQQGRVEIHSALSFTAAPIALHTYICIQAAQSAAPSGQSPPALPVRPFSAQPRHSETQARAASHPAASTSSSGNLAAGQKRPAGSAAADADASGGGSAKLGKPPQPQAPPRKRPRLQPHPPSVHDVTGKATRTARDRLAQRELIATACI